MITEKTFVDQIKSLEERVRTLELYTTSNNVGGWRQAGEVWTYASADDPTYTFTTPGDKTDKYSAGMRVRVEQTTTKYFLISKDPTYSAGSGLTTVTLYGGTDYDLTSADIERPAFSEAKTPQGFPTSPGKWTEVTTGSGTQSAPTATTWYNVGSLSIEVPIGSWRLTYSAEGYTDWDGVAAAVDDMFFDMSLSTSSNSESDANMTIRNGVNLDTGHNQLLTVSSTGHKEKGVTLTTKDDYYYIMRTASSGIGALGCAFVSIKAVSSFL